MKFTRRIPEAPAPESAARKKSSRIPAWRAAFLFALLSCFASAAQVDVFFVGGQSNAKTQFRDGIQSALTASGRFPNMQVVYVNHSGSPIESWYNNGRQAFYREDLYDPSPTVKGLMETACDNIVAAGNTYRIRGFFWFQGETDRTKSSSYAAKFNGMLGQLATDLNQGEPVPFGITLIAYNPNVIPSPLTQAEKDGVMALRVVQKSLAESSPVGSYADSIDCPRSDIWHVLYLNGPPNSLSTFGTALGNAFLANQFPLYWDTNGTSAGFGTASGTWGTDFFWNSSPTGTSGTFSGTTNTTNTLNFGNETTGLGTGTVNVGTVSSGNMIFASGSGEILLSGGTITLAPAVTITTDNTTSTINSTLTGASTSLTKAGAGTLILTGSNNHTGVTTVGSGKLLLGAGGSIGASPVTVATNATLGSLSSTTRTIAAATTYNSGAQATFTADGGASSAVGRISVTGNLTLNANPITVHVTGDALAVGDYPLLVCSGTLTSTGSFATPTITGTPLAGTVPSIVVNAGAGGSIVLHIAIPGDPTATTLTRPAGASPSVYGDSLTFSATVYPDPGDGSTITFKINGVQFGTSTTISGIAEITTSTLPYSAGSPFTVTAHFGGNESYEMSFGSLSGGQQVDRFPLTLSSATAQNKIYDGTTNATITGGTLSATVNGDIITANTGTFAQSTVGTGIPVTVNLTGTAAANYILTQPGLTANIEIPPTPTWANTSGGIWDTADNWVSNNIGSGSGVMADFSTLDISADATVNLNSPRTIGNLSFSDSHPTTAASWILANNGNAANTLTLAGTTPTITVNTLGTGKSTTIDAVIAGSSGLLKAGDGDLALTKANTYTGNTTLGQGSLAFGANQNLSGALTFGTADGSTTTSILDLTNANATFAGALTVQTHNVAANTITIGSGKTLTTNNNVTIGTAAVSGNSNLLVAGDVDGNGTWTVTKTGGTFQVGGGDNSSAITNVASLDMSYLGTFTANLGSTGTFRVGEYSTGQTSGSSSVILANTSTITADTLNIGHNSAGYNTVHSLKLGIQTQTLNTNTINIGLSTQFERSGGSITFNDAAGTLKVRAANGTGAADLNMHKSGTTTSGTISNTFDVSGHTSDLLFSTVDLMNVISPGGAASSAYSSTFSFDKGALAITTLKIGTRAFGSVGAAVQIATANIGSADNLMNTASLGTVTMATVANSTGGITGRLNIAGAATSVGITSLTLANNTSTGATATGIVNVSGGTTTVTGGITLAARTSTGTATGTLNLTGGSLTVGGNIAITGTATATLTIDGGTLDMAGYNIGGVGQLVSNLNFRSGTLKNVAQINNGAGLTKTTAGTLILAGTHTYTGATHVNEGILSVSGSIGATAVDVLDGATLSGNGNIGGSVTIQSGGRHAISVATTTGAQDTSLITGDLILAGGNILDLTAGSPPATGVYILATVTGSITGTPTTINLSGFPGLTGTVAVNGKKLELTVALIPTFLNWIDDFGLSLAAQDLNADPDNDDIPNLLEYVLNGDPSISDSSIQPQLGTSGANFIFSYERRDASLGDTTQTFQYGSELDSWTDILIPATGNTVGAATVTVTPGIPTDTVSISIPETEAGNSGKLFGRLKATHP